MQHVARLMGAGFKTQAPFMLGEHWAAFPALEPHLFIDMRHSSTEFLWGQGQHPSPFVDSSSDSQEVEGGGVL